jgi:trans-aconitate methyltransferase
VTDAWTSGTDYDAFIGRWSQRVAPAFLRWLAVPAGGAWLDFGCGTGALTRAILDEPSPRSVVGCDRSPDYIAHARQQGADARASFVVADFSQLPRTPGGFDAIVSGLVLNFLPDALSALRDLTARGRSGTIVAAYVWDYAEGMQLLRTFWDAAVELDSTARDVDEGRRFPLCAPGALRDLFEHAGLSAVEVEPIVVSTPLRGFADYWNPFLSGQGPAPGYVKSLSAERRQRLQAALRQRLPVAEDGAISLSARAWAVKGIAP